MTKNNNVAIPSGGEGEVLDPLPPSPPPMHAYLSGHFYFFRPRFIGWTLILIAPVPDRCLLITFLFYLKAFQVSRFGPN